MKVNLSVHRQRYNHVPSVIKYNGIVLAEIESSHWTLSQQVTEPQPAAFTSCGISVSYIWRVSRTLSSRNVEHTRRLAIFCYTTQAWDSLDRQCYSAPSGGGCTWTRILKLKAQIVNACDIPSSD